MANDNIHKMYERLSTRFDLGTEEQFRDYVTASTDNSKKMYERMSTRFYLGTEQEWLDFMGDAKQQRETAAAKGNAEGASTFSEAEIKAETAAAEPQPKPWQASGSHRMDGGYKVPNYSNTKDTGWRFTDPETGKMRTFVEQMEATKSEQQKAAEEYGQSKMISDILAINSKREIVPAERVVVDAEGNEVERYWSSPELSKEESDYQQKQEYLNKVKLDGERWAELTAARDAVMADYNKELGKAYEELKDVMVYQDAANPFGPEQFASNRQELANLKAAKKYYDEALSMIKEVRADEDSPEGFLGGLFGLGRGLLESGTDAATWDMGMSDMNQGAAVLTAIMKLEDGKPLSKNEERLLSAAAAHTYASSQLGDQIGMGYKAGQTTMKSVPFMIEMALNPASGLGSAGSKALSKHLVKKYGKEMIEKQLKKRLKSQVVASKLGAKVAGDAGSAVAMTGTSGLGMTIADAEQRMIGTVKPTEDEEGNIVYGGREDYETSAATAYAKAFGSGAIERHTEMVGGYLPAVKTGAAKFVTTAAKKTKSPRLKKIYAEASNILDGKAFGKWGETVAKVADKTKLNDLAGEFFEEKVGEVENALLVGDMTFDANSQTGIFNLDRNIETFVGLLPMQVAFGAMTLVGYRTQKARQKKAMQAAEKINQETFGDRWADIKSEFDGCETNEQLSKALLDKMKQSNSRERAAMLTYVKAVQQQRGLDEVKDLTPALSEGEGAPVEQASENLTPTLSEGWGAQVSRAQRAYQRGVSAIENNDNAELEQIGYDYDLAEARVGRLFDEQQRAEIDEASDVDGGLESWLESNRENLSAEQVAAVEKLNDAYEAYTGVLDTNDNQNRAEQEALRKQMQPFAMQNGALVELQLVNGTRVWLKSGDPTDKRKTVMASFYDADHGIVKTTQISGLEIERVGTPMSVDEYVASKLHDSQDALATQREQLMNGKSVAAGQTVRLYAGDELQEYEVTAMNDGMASLQAEDGSQMMLSQEELQEEMSATRQRLIEEELNVEAEDRKLGNLTPENLTPALSEGEGAAEGGVQEDARGSKRTGEESLATLSEEEAQRADEVIDQMESVEAITQSLAALGDSPLSKSLQGELYKAERRLKALTEALTETDKAKVGQRMQERESQRREPLRQRAKEWEAKTGTKVELIEDAKDVKIGRALRAIIDAEGRGAQVKGWYDRDTGKVYLYLPHIDSEKDIDETYIHEVVAHKGLRELLDKGESSQNFNALCDMVWNGMNSNARKKYESYEGVADIADQTARQRAAADEYMAHLAEKMNLAEQSAGDAASVTERIEAVAAALTAEEKTVWDKIVEYIKSALASMGVNNVSNNDIEALIRASYARMASENLTSENLTPALSEGEGAAEGGVQKDARGSKRTEEGIGKSLNKEEAEILMNEMEAAAETAPDIELTIENWDALFGQEGKVSTPIGNVKMGENQFAKMMRQGRDTKLGMVKPTLENPYVIIEVETEAKKGTITERPSSYIFVRSFVKKDGTRYYYFTSITVSKDNKEVVISNQEKSRNRIMRLLQEGSVIWRTPKDATTSSAEKQGLDYALSNKAETVTKGSEITPQTTPSGSKDTDNASEMQERSVKSAEKVSKVKRLNQEQAEILLTNMEANAELSNEKELNAESWAETFDENNSIETPIGRVKMGEHQIIKFFDKNRSKEFGMVGPTLSNPDIIIAESSQAKDGKSERATSYLFIKTFNRNGEKIKYYTSITVKQDGLEISVSSHYTKRTKVARVMQEGEIKYIKETLLPNSSDWRLTEHQEDVPDLLPTQGNNASSGSKDTDNTSEMQERSVKSAEKVSKVKRQRAQRIGNAASRKRLEEAKRQYAGSEAASLFFEDMDVAHDANELVAMTLGKGSINWEGIDRGGHHVRGLQEELGRDKQRGLKKESDTYGYNQYLARKGEGKGIDEIVHDIWESEANSVNGEKRFDTEEIRDALLDVLTSAQKPSDISDYVLMNRIALAEAALEYENETAAYEQELYEQEQREMAEREGLLLLTDEVIAQMNADWADKIAEIEEKLRTEREIFRQLLEQDTNLEEYYGREEYYAGEESADKRGIRMAEESATGRDSSSIEGSQAVHRGTQHSVEGNRPMGNEQVPETALGRETGRNDDNKNVRSQEAERSDLGNEPNEGDGSNWSDELAAAKASTDINPTDAQKEAGNFKKGHLTFGGYKFTIENPKGSVRSGKDKKGKAWSVTMPVTYGYILGKRGKDGDHLDMFINDNADLSTWNGEVFVIDQVNPETGKFDEHKVMYGFNNITDAMRAYLMSYTRPWRGMGNITGVSKETFEQWVASSERKLKPFAETRFGDKSDVGTKVLRAAEARAGKRQEDETAEQQREQQIEKGYKRGYNTYRREQYSDETLQEMFASMSNEAIEADISKMEREIEEAKAYKDSDEYKELRANEYSDYTRAQTEGLAARAGRSVKALESKIAEAKRVMELRDERGEGLNDTDRVNKPGNIRFRFSNTPEEFEATQKEAVEKKGILMDGLNDAVVNIVDVPRHDFTGRGIDAINKAREWANKNINKEHTYHEGQDDEFKYKIDDDAIDKFLSSSSTKASDNLGVHLAVLKKLPEVIDNSIDVEIHPDYKKKDGKRLPENGVGRQDMLVHRMYGAVDIDGKIYCAKTTIHEFKDKDNEAYTYKITEVKLIVSGSTTSNARTNSTSISAANLLKDVEKSYEPGKKVLDESKDLTSDSENATDMRFSVKDIQEEYDIPSELFDYYKKSIELGNLTAATQALNGIKDVIRHNVGKKLSEFVSVYKGIRNVIFDELGDIEKLREERERAAIEQYDLMEAARKRAEEEAAIEAEKSRQLEMIVDLDSEYDKALQVNDMERAQDLVSEAARRKGYIVTDYKDAHSAPVAQIERKEFRNLEALRDLSDNGFDLNVFALANGISNQPLEIFDRGMERAYMNVDAAGRESLAAIRSAISAIKDQLSEHGEVKDMPKIKVYRAVPKSIKGGLESGGQWVSPSLTYTQTHGEHRHGEGKYRIIEEEVPADELWWDGNDVREWGFDDGRNYVYKNTKNNKKLFDTITYDDAGEIIPLSKRFNSKKTDVRFRVKKSFEAGSEYDVEKRADKYFEARGLVTGEYQTPHQLLEAVRNKHEEYAWKMNDDATEIECLGRWDEMLPKKNGRNDGSGRNKRIAKKTERAKAMIGDVAKMLGLDVEVLEDTDNLTGKKKTAKGWYDVTTRKITVVLPNHTSSADVMGTLLHEGVAHHGLRKMFGKDFDAMLDNVYEGAWAQDEIDALAGENASVERIREATEEYLASLAEDMNFEKATEQKWWSYIKEAFVSMLRKAGVTIDVWLTDNELRYLLWRSYQNLKETSEQRTALETMEDYKKQKKLGVYDGTGRIEPAAGVAEDIRFRYTEEEQKIVDEAKKNGTWMKAPNGKATNLTEKQWAQVRTKAFKKWFGDWEKVLRIAKLRKSKPVDIVFNGEYELNRDSAKQWMKDNLRGEYVNEDTGEKITITKIGANKVTSHGERNEAHLKSIVAIPSLIEKSVFIEELPNEKENDKYDSYRYYVCGAQIDGIDYTIKVVVGVKGDVKYYDHRLTQIEKGTLIDNLNGMANSVVENQNADISVGKDTKLLSILQTNSSKIVDENGEPMVVYHGTMRHNFTVFKNNGSGIYFTPDKDAADYGLDADPYAVFINMREPLNLDFEGDVDNEATENHDSLENEYKNAIAEGYDGVVAENTFDGENEMTQIVVHRPNQIKSATDNVGTFDEGNDDIRFRVANDNQEVFVSNAEQAVKGIKQEKATPQQWKAMIQSKGGLKAGEDKWLGLSEWLDEKAKAAEANGSNKANVITKQEVLDFIGENKIRIEDVEYGDANSSAAFASLKEEYDQWLREEGSDYAWEQLTDRYGDDAEIAFWDLGGELAISNEEAATALLGENVINSTRLDYTTEGLENKREIALTVPTIESWNESDEIHFGDAGGGRAVAWVRFGETTDSEGNSVLVIDEIQSKRHQEGREQGYKENINPTDITFDEYAFYYNGEEVAYYGVDNDGNTIINIYGHGGRKLKSDSEEEAKKAIASELSRGLKGIPDAPFDKNWHELAMKRMLRLAAEEGFDKVAWTKGAQQAERYNIGTKINHIHVIPSADEMYVSISPINGRIIETPTEPNSDIIISGEYKGKSLTEVYGKSLADKIKSVEVGADERIAGNGLRIGGEGMKGFYDNILPRFMNKYGKKWGVKVGEVELPELEESGRTMWSVDVTPEMKESVMEGQVMFRFVGEQGAANMDKAEEATVRLDNLNVAREMEEAGKDAKAIKMATGWERGADGKWRYEVDDNMEGIASPMDKLTALYKEYKSAEKSFDRLMETSNRLSQQPRTATAEQKAKRKEFDKRLKEARETWLAKREAFMEADNKRSYTLEEILGAEHELFAAYPQLKTRNVSYMDKSDYADYSGAYMPESGDFWISPTADNPMSVLTHEIQHAIQHIEGFAQGGNLSSSTKKLAEVMNVIGAPNGLPFNNLVSYLENGMETRQQHKQLLAMAEANGYDDIVDYVESLSPYGYYRRVSGEVESRNVQKRMGMTAEERRASLAEETEDVAREDQVFIFDGLANGANESNETDGANKAKLSSSNKAVAMYDKANGTNVKGFFNYLRNNKQAKKGEPTSFHIGNAGSLLEQYGIKGKFMVGQFTFSATHTENEDHNLSVNDWVNVINNLNNPLAITSYKGMPNQYRIYTYAMINGKNICVGVNVSLADGEISLSRIISAYGRDINNLLGKEKTNLIYPDIEELKRRISQGSTTHNSWLNATSTASGDKGTKKDLDLQGNEGKVSFSVRDWRKEIRDAAEANGTWLKAPNGKPTNLTQNGWLTVRSGEFKKWLGDWEKGGPNFKKVLDVNGEPQDWVLTAYKLRPQRPARPKRAKGESQAVYFSRYRLWERAVDAFIPAMHQYLFAVLNGRLGSDIVSNEESFIEKAQAQYETDLAKWKEEQGIPDDATPEEEQPMPLPGERSLDYANRLTQWQRRQAAWKLAPKLENYIQAAKDDYMVYLAKYEVSKYPLSRASNIKLESAQLAKLRHAVARQKSYDKNTVQAVVDFAQQFLMQGFGDNIGRGDIRHLLSAVRNATGVKDIKQNIDKIIDILVDNHIRNIENAIQKMASIKAHKMNAQNVSVQGKLELRGQRLIKAYNEARATNMTIEELEDMLSSLTEKMADADPDTAAMYSAEYDGYSLALMYAKDITESLKEYTLMRKELRDAESNRELTYREKAQLVEQLRASMLDNRVERIHRYSNFIDEFSRFLDESIEGAKDFNEAQKRHQAEIYNMAMSDLAEVSSGTDLVIDRKSESLMTRLSNSPLTQFFSSPLATFEQILKLFGQKYADGRGRLYNYFMQKWAEATRNEWNGKQKQFEILDDKAREIFGGKVKRWADLYSIVGKMPGIVVSYLDVDGIRKTTKLTQGNLLYIYMANKMTDGAIKLRKQGISESDMAVIEEKLDPRLKSLADWVQSDFFVESRKKYNKIHMRLFGAPMAEIENYVPIRILSDARYQEQDVARLNKDTLPSTVTGAIVNRRMNSLPLDITGTDALSLVVEHVEEMEHWAAFAEFSKDISTLLSYTPFRNKVKNMQTVYGSGDTLWDRVMEVSNLAAGTYRPVVKRNTIDNAVANISKGLTLAKVAFRINTALKQLVSAIGFLHDIDIYNLFQNPFEAWKWAIKAMPQFQERWLGRKAGDTRLEDSDLDWKQWRQKFIKMSAYYGMTPNAFVDAVVSSCGAYAVYKTKYKRYKNTGYDNEQAHKKALLDAEQSFNLTQQSSKGAYIATIQVDRTVAASALSVFRNSSFSFARQSVEALRNLRRKRKRGYKEEAISYMKGQMMLDGIPEDKAEAAAKAEYSRSIRRDLIRIAVFSYMNTIAWQLAGYWSYLLFGDDDEEKEKALTDALLRGMLAGPIEGLAGGNILSDLIGISVSSEGFTTEGLKNYRFYGLPAFSDIQKMIETFDHDQVAGLQDVINLLVQIGVGTNPETLTNSVIALIDYCNGDLGSAFELGLLLLRLNQSSSKELDNYYIDALGMSSDEIKKADFDELAKRWATYKMRQNAPMTSWLYSDEREKKKLESYMKAFDKKVQKRMEGLTEEQFEQNYNRSESNAERLMAIKIGGEREGVKHASKMKNAHLASYLKKSTWDDIREDMEIEKKKRELSAVDKRLKEARDSGASDEALELFKQENKKELDLYDAIVDTLKDIRDYQERMQNADKQESDELLNDIRQKRKELLELFKQ